jgi:hypothetical protein
MLGCNSIFIANKFLEVRDRKSRSLRQYPVCNQDINRHNGLVASTHIDIRAVQKEKEVRSAAIGP